MKRSTRNTANATVRQLRIARQAAAGYRLVIRPDAVAGFLGSCPEMPRVLAYGETPEACMKSLRESLEAALVILLKTGDAPPPSQAARSEQLNIRLTGDERQRIEEAARHEGFRGAADFVRNAVLTKLNTRPPTSPVRS